MNILHLVLMMTLILVAMFVIGSFVRGWVATTAVNKWEHALGAAWGSATILWARFVALLAALIGMSADFATMVNAPGIADNIRTLINPSQMAIVMLVVAVISEIARRRTL